MVLLSPYFQRYNEKHMTTKASVEAFTFLKQYFLISSIIDPTYFTQAVRSE